MPDNHKIYDEEPVEYCTKCYSLKIKYEDAIDGDCCMDCGCTETATASIEDWERLYESRYGHKFVEKSDNPRTSLWFKMPLSKLKVAFYRSEHFYEILNRLYPRFPHGLSKTEMVILLFDKLCKDGRIDDLRYLMWKEERSKE